ncbi:MAG: xylulokinase [Solirubrobacteraceae bacterium]|jgi:xylulokinase
MFIGIDIGTSAVKLVLVDAGQQPVATVEEALHPRQPRPGWSEDDAEAWWTAVAAGLDRLRGGHAQALGRVQAIGLSGQMHGALLLDAADRPVRPAILWNDGRSAAEADRLADLGLPLQNSLGVRPMPGFTGPKLAWLRSHEPEVLDRTHHLLLPKDYVRLRLTGERVTDVSDAAGTWLFDQARRTWSAEALEACGVERAWLPRLVESNAVSGTLLREVAKRWGLPPDIPVAGGGGDTAVGGVGIGAVDTGHGFVSLGTSGQVFLADARYRPDPERLVHGFCHAVPGRWYAMSALLNGASPLAAAVRWTGGGDIGATLERVEARFEGPSRLLALPYLFGERTPHNDPYARGAIIGLTGSTEPADIVQAVLEGVAFSLADGLDVLAASVGRPDALGFIGGGARSLFWGRMIAAVLDTTLVRYRGADRGPAFGAARLARLCATGEPVGAVATAPPVEGVIASDARLRDLYAPRLAAFRALYRALRPEFARDEDGRP